MKFCFLSQIKVTVDFLPNSLILLANPVNIIKSIRYR